ncbi:esterase/lipase family protein [Bacillus marinisedimentorum]|uniref:esterase/lipase family protein n=1 Tax=Bacillus marinisedimentorum TaxID=1821260 RepID=UPI0007E277DD|nr:hypothetical protein [Bacillus marinisedimentorum]
MLKRWFLLVIALFFVFPTISLAGSFGKDDPSGVPGQWYVGTTPADVAPSKYPVLFVHGLNSSSNTWWQDNNMYDTAYQNGYETAFIDLYPTKTMWDNGAMLAQKIKDIYNHFGEKVVIVAHSKGGVDSQSALVHYGASPYVERLITLSSPHQGSELADLAHSSWAGWLAGILGSKSDATYSLQTGYMAYFRSVTDSHANLYKTPIYTFGGTKWGSFGSSLYWGGLYLRAYGSNDGAVTVNSSRLPYAQELAVGSWNHSTIKEGPSTFHLFQDYLNESLYTAASFGARTMDNAATASGEAGHYLSGGEYTGVEKEHFNVEEGVEELEIDWISDQPSTDLSLVSPDGERQSDFAVVQDKTEYLKGAYHHSLAIPNPTAGKWSIQAKTNQQERYLMNVTFDSQLNNLLETNIKGDEVKLKIRDKKMKVKSAMTLEYYRNGKLKQRKVNVNQKTGEVYNLPDLGEGVYNMTINIEGLRGKEKFNRTIVESVYVDGTGKVYGR